MEFAATREALASLYDETPFATLLCEPHELRIVGANRAAETLLGRSASDLSGASWPSLTNDSQQLLEALCAAVSGGRSSVELEMRSGEGTAMRVTCEIFPAHIGERAAGAFVQLRAHDQPFNDPLTGLPSGAMLDDRIEQTLMTARRYDYRFAIVLADIDAFSTIVERHGAGAGDWVLRVVAQRVREALRRSDSVMRAAKDRFVVIQPMVESVDDAVDVAHKIVFAMHAPIVIDGRNLDVRLSLGIALFPIDGDLRESLMASAQEALHDAKHHARGLFRLAKNSSLEPAT